MSNSQGDSDFVIPSFYLCTSFFLVYTLFTIIWGVRAKNTEVEKWQYTTVIAYLAVLLVYFLTALFEYPLGIDREYMMIPDKFTSGLVTLTLYYFILELQPIIISQTVDATLD